MKINKINNKTPTCNQDTLGCAHDKGTWQEIVDFGVDMIRDLLSDVYQTAVTTILSVVHMASGIEGWMQLKSVLACMLRVVEGGISLRNISSTITDILNCIIGALKLIYTLLITIQ